MNKEQTTKRILIAVTLMAALLATSCQTTDLAALSPSQVEEKIIKEARTVGTVGGALAGAAVGYLANDWKGALYGGLAGAAVGNRIGNAQGQKQASNYQAARMEGDRLNRLVAEARSYNTQVAQYNSKLQAEIALIETTTGTERAQLAAAQSKSASQSLQSVNQVITVRQNAMQNLQFSNRSAYEAEYQTLVQRRDELEKSLEKLNSLGTTTVG